nr:hypothetical protein PEB16_06670 [Staphylococcus aureus]WFO06480.1 hypothetical protein P9A63_06785 [Staphylococcus aureus]
MKNTAMRALNFAVKIKNNYKQLYAHDNRLLSSIIVTLSAIVVFVLPFLYFRWLT